MRRLVLKPRRPRRRIGTVPIAIRWFREETRDGRAGLPTVGRTAEPTVGGVTVGGVTDEEMRKGREGGEGGPNGATGNEIAVGDKRKRHPRRRRDENVGKRKGRRPKRRRKEKTLVPASTDHPKSEKGRQREKTPDPASPDQVEGSLAETEVALDGPTAPEGMPPQDEKDVSGELRRVEEAGDDGQTDMLALLEKALGHERESLAAAVRELERREAVIRESMEESMKLQRRCTALQKELKLRETSEGEALRLRRESQDDLARCLEEKKTISLDLARAAREREEDRVEMANMQRALRAKDEDAAALRAQIEWQEAVREDDRRRAGELRYNGPPSWRRCNVMQ